MINGLVIRPITEKEFDDLREEWNQLLHMSPADNVFLRWEWIHTWWTVFGKGKKLFILAVHRQNHLIGLAPFYILSEGPLGSRHLRFCSDTLSPDYLDIIAEKGEEAAVFQALLTYLTQSPPLWDTMALNHLRRDSLLARDTPWERYGHSLQAQDVCPYIRMEGTFEDYIHSCTELKRFALKRKQRHLFEQDHAVHYCVPRDEKMLSLRFDQLFDLHAKRAVAIGRKTPFIGGGDVQRFHYEVSRLFLQEGILNLQFLYAGETPLSAHYCFNYEKKVYYYQSGFDPAWSRRSVSMVLMFLNVQKAFREGFQEFDYLKGNEEYKSFWSNAIRDEMQLTIYNQTLAGMLEQHLLSLKSYARLLKRTLLSVAHKEMHVSIDSHPPQPVRPEN